MLNVNSRWKHLPTGGSLHLNRSRSSRSDLRRWGTGPYHEPLRDRAKDKDRRCRCRRRNSLYPLLLQLACQRAPMHSQSTRGL